MAGQAGQPPADLTAELLKKGHEFSFFQVLRLLRLLGHAAEMPEDPAAPVPTVTPNAPATKITPATEQLRPPATKSGSDTPDQQPTPATQK